MNVPRESNRESEPLPRVERPVQESDHGAVGGEHPAADRLLSLLDSPDSSSPRIVELLQSFPHVAEELMRLANAATVGLRSPVDQLDRAIAVLGLRRVRELVAQRLRLDPAHPFPSPNRSRDSRTTVDR